VAFAHGTIDLSDIPKEEFNADLELRVAAVNGDAILGSTVVKAKEQKGRVPFELEFDPFFNPGAVVPCGLRLIVGPNVADRELLSLDVASTTYEFTKPARSTRAKKAEAAEITTAPDEADTERARAQAAKLRVDIGEIAVLPHIYRCWLWCCRVYRIRGRVVCRNWRYNPITRRWTWCDDPVPGAKVDIYDVDRFLWWYREDLITTATTHVDGTFEATFTWCCRRFPWWDGWLIDQDILRHIRELLLERNVILKPPPPDPDPRVLQELAASLTPRPAPSTAAAAPVVEAVSTSAESLRSLLPESERLSTLRVWPWWDTEDCEPDVIFRARQLCHGKEEVIHYEAPAQARWNIPTNLNVTLLANDKACCLPVCRDPECPDCMKLTWVACVPIDHIADGSFGGSPDLRGYVNVPGQADEPMYGSLQMRGDIGTDIDYFRVQYSKDGGAWTDLPTPEFAGYSRRYWQGAPGFSPYIPFVPVSKVYGGGNVVVISTRHHYEELNPGLPRFGGDVFWDDWDTLFYFATDASPSLGDGLFELRFIGYAADAGDDLVAGTEEVIDTCGLPTWETVYLRIDNQLNPNHPAVDHTCGGTTTHFCVDEPDAYIRNLVKNEGLWNQQPVSVCDIVDLEPTDTLTVHFSVTVPATAKDGHLGGYQMWADYGASQRFYIGGAGVGAPCPDPSSSVSRGIFEADPGGPLVQVGPSYADALAQGAPRPHWYGGNYKVTLRGCDFPVCCAYEIYLHGWKRTTNGCASPEWTHWNQYHNTFTVLRRDLCPDICVDNTEPARVG
jgi:hypothetical protein